MRITKPLVLFVLLVLAMLPVFAGCDFLGDEEEHEPLMPLAVGNYWAYESTYLETIVDSFTVEITRTLEVEHAGRTYRVFGQIAHPNEVPDRPPYTWLYGNGPNGLYTMGGVADTDTFAVRHLYRKYPGDVGETWPMVRLLYSNTTGDFAVRDSLETTLEATEEPFATPLGTFQCYVYKYTFMPAEDVTTLWDVFEYYAPGIGMVGQVIRGRWQDEDHGEKQRVVLYDYRVR